MVNGIGEVLPVDWEYKNITGASGIVDRLIVIVTYDYSLQMWKHTVIDPLANEDERKVDTGYALSLDQACVHVVEDASDYIMYLESLENDE